MNTVLWIRNNSHGESKLLNSTLIEMVYALRITFSHLSDSLSADKLPYSYQCLVIGVCCEELRSKYKTIDLGTSTVPSPTIGSVTSHIGKFNFFSIVKPLTDEHVFYHKFSYDTFSMPSVLCMHNNFFVTCFSLTSFNVVVCRHDAYTKYTMQR